MSDRRTIIILCPPLSTGQTLAPGFDYLAAGFAKTWELLGQGHRVHLIADGCTVSGIRPEWSADVADLELSELGEYRRGDPIEESRELASAVRGWLDAAFAPACDASIAAGRVFYASFAGRILQPLFYAVPFAEGLAAAFPRGRFVVIGPSWLGTPLLGALVQHSGGSVEPPEAAQTGWPLRFAVRLVWSLGRAIAGQLVNYIKSRPGRGFIAARRRPGASSPDVWVGLVPDWQRINHHVIERVLLPSLALGRTVGIFLTFTLAGGERTASDRAATAQGPVPWPTIAQLPWDRDDLVFEQLIRPTSAFDLLVALARGAAASLTIGRTLMQQGPVFQFGRYDVHLQQYLRPLAALATIDVLQVTAVSAAVAEAGTRYDFDGVPVVFASVGGVDTATADRLLSTAGATTVNFVHGALGDMWAGQNENCSDVMMVWTEADLRSCRKQGSFGAVLPIGGQSPLPAKSGRRRNVLFITSYLHHDWAQAGFPWRPFLVEILRCRDVISALDPERFQFRWRPHPSDVADALAQVSAQFPGLPKSAGTTLREDVEWADFVIMYPSTATLDALDADVPVFLQVAPSMRRLPEVEAADPKRVFFRAEDLREPFRELLSALDLDPVGALEPERALRAAILGEHQSPDDILAFLSEVRAQAVSRIPSNPST